MTLTLSHHCQRKIIPTIFAAYPKLDNKGKRRFAVAEHKLYDFSVTDSNVRRQIFDPKTATVPYKTQ